MKAPLPEVPPFVPKKRDFAKEAPLSLSVLCAIDAIFGVLYLPLHTPDPEISLFWNWVIAGVSAALGLLLTYYLWRGYGWARGIWLWLTGVSWPFYFFFADEAVRRSRAEQISDYFYFAFSLFLLVWLNLPNVKAHFAQRKTVKSN